MTLIVAETNPLTVHPKPYEEFRCDFEYLSILLERTVA